MGLMKQIEDDKVKNQNSGWGQIAKKSGNNDPDQFNQYQDNIQKAIQKLEINEKAKGAGASQASAILEETIVEGSGETMDDRKRRLQEHKDKLIADRAKERKEELMRTSFNGIIKDEENAAIVLDNEKKK